MNNIPSFPKRRRIRPRKETKPLAQRPSVHQEADILTKPEAASLLKITVRGLEKWMEQKRIPFYRLSYKIVRFKRSDLEAHLKNNCLVAATN